MSFLKNIFKKKEKPIKSYEDFWDWFRENEKFFFGVVKGRGDVKRFFFDKLSVKLNELRPGFFYLVGMPGKNTVELILTADGIVKNIAFAEELVKAAPRIDGWLS
jgi:hypothetical protein